MPEIKQDIRAATFIVAANDSVHKNMADYVCVPPDTLVFANPMVKPISQVALGEKVLSHSGYREVTKIFKRPFDGNLIQIKTYGGETFRLTPNHPVYAIQDTLAEDGYCKRAQTHKRLRKLALNYSPRWIRADKLEKGDVVLLRFPSEERDTQEISLTDYLTVPYIEQDNGIWGIGRNQTGKIQRNPRAHKLPRVIHLSDDFLKLAGYYLAEGSSSKNNVCLYFGKHQAELIDEIRQLFQKVFGITAHTENTRTSTRVYVNSVLLANIFTNLFGSNADNKHLPELALYLPHNKQRVLLDAYSRGDGCQDNKRERFVSVSQQLAYQVRQILYRLGRQNSIERKPAGEYEIEGRKGFTKEKFEICACFNANGSFIDKHFAYLPIREISSLPYEGEVCNLQVDGANSYTTVGATLHNCDGVNDHVEIQAAIDALPATGGEVRLLDGTYNCEATINLDSNQTLRGCGRNTILTTSTAGLTFLSAVGVALTHLANIVISDMQIDGGAGGVSEFGISFNYVDYSLIQNVYSRRHRGGMTKTGIYFLNSDFNQVVNNVCQGNSTGIFLDTSDNNTISGNISQGNISRGIFLQTCDDNVVANNTCQGNGDTGIDLSTARNNTIVGNTCRGNDYGIVLGDSFNNTVIGNTCQGNDFHGIYLSLSNNNNVIGNTCIRNSLGADNTYDNLYLMESSYNLILGNLCRAPTVGTTLTVGEPAGETDIEVTSTAPWPSLGFEVGDGVVLDLGGINEEYHHISAITAGEPGIITIPAPGLTNDQGAGETIDVPEAQYGINVSDAASTENVVRENDL